MRGVPNKGSYYGNSFLTERQVEILRLRRNNVSRGDIAKSLRITRQDVTILEKRAMNNVERAFNTINLAAMEGYSVRVKLTKGTPILDAIKEILDAGNRNGVKVGLSIPELFTLIRMNQEGKIKQGILFSDMDVNILQNGRLITNQ